MENIPGITPYAIALYPFKGEFADELSFAANDIILLSKHIDGDWIEGEIDGKTGIFPANHVAIQIDCTHSESATSSKARSSDRCSFDGQVVSQSSKRHLETPKSLSANTFVTENVDIDKGLKGSVENNRHWSVNWLSSKNEDIQPDSTGTRRNSWLSFDSGLGISSSFTSDSTKKSVCKSSSVPAGFHEDNKNDCSRNRFVLKNKRAPPAPWARSNSLPSNDPWEITGGPIRAAPQLPHSPHLPIPDNANISKSKANAEKLFGEFGYAATKLFRTPSDNANIQESDTVIPNGLRKQTSDVSVFEAVFGMKADNEETPKTKAKSDKDTGNMKDNVTEAPKPVPRRRASENTATTNKETTKQNDAGLTPIPAPRKSILKVKESRNMTDDHQGSSSDQTNPTKKDYLMIAIKQPSEPDKNSDSNKVSLRTNKVAINDYKDNFNLTTTEKSDTPTPKTTRYIKETNRKALIQTATDKETDRSAPKSLNKTTAVQNHKNNTKGDVFASVIRKAKPTVSDKPKTSITGEQNKQEAHVPVKAEINDSVYSEINAETSDDYYAVIEKDSSENYYTAMPTLDMRISGCETETRLIGNNIKPDFTNIKIPPPPAVSKRNKYITSNILPIVTEGVKGQNSVLQNNHLIKAPVKASSVTKEESKVSKKVVTGNISDDDAVSNESAVGNTYYISPVSQETEEDNIYEVMWPVQPKDNPQISIPPPLPPRRRPLHAQLNRLT